MNPPTFSDCTPIKGEGWVFLISIASTSPQENRTLCAHLHFYLISITPFRRMGHAYLYQTVVMIHV